MAELWMNDNGTQRKGKEVWFNDGGTLRKAKEIWMNDNGIIRKVFSGGPVPWSFSLKVGYLAKSTKRYWGFDPALSPFSGLDSNRGQINGSYLSPAVSKDTLLLDADSTLLYFRSYKTTKTTLIRFATHPAKIASLNVTIDGNTYVFTAAYDLYYTTSDINLYNYFLSKQTQTVSVTIKPIPVA